MTSWTRRLLVKVYLSYLSCRKAENSELERGVIMHAGKCHYSKANHFLYPVGRLFTRKRDSVLNLE